MRALILGLLCAASVVLNLWLMQDRSRLQDQVREQEETLRAATAEAEAAEAEEQRIRANASAEVARERAELIRLRGEVARLRRGTNTLAELEQQVVQLRAQLATRSAAPTAGPEPDGAAIAAARDRARSIQCINHLKQIGLAARIFATEHDDHLPTAWMEMTTELGSPRILVCPADTEVTAPADWSGWDPSLATYRLIAPGISETEVSTAYAECPIHGHRVMADGSVQQGTRAQP